MLLTENKEVEMQWKQVMQKGGVTLFSVEQAKEFCQANPLTEYQVVDVRQPGEYAVGHIPGATLIPLDQLLSGQGELDQTKPTLVYCHAGRRSAVAAQWMVENGFERVLDMQGGFQVWSGLAASGPAEHNLNLIGQDAEYPDALSLSYAMEEGLQIFYQKLAERVEQPKLQELLLRLASFEDHHKDSLQAKGGAEFAPNPRQYAGIMEGGFSVEQLVEQLLPRMTNAEELFSLALAIEAQAYDFYGRLAKHAQKEESAKLFLEMAEEEKKHLGLLAQELDQVLAARA